LLYFSTAGDIHSYCFRQETQSSSEYHPHHRQLHAQYSAPDTMPEVFGPFLNRTLWLGRFGRLQLWPGLRGIADYCWYACLQQKYEAAQHGYQWSARPFHSAAAYVDLKVCNFFLIPRLF
jgi:hypothetical protein